MRFSVRSYHITIPRRHHTHTLKDKIDDKVHSSNPQVVANTMVSIVGAQKYGLKAARRAPQFSKR